MLRAASAISLVTLFSRIAGLVRDTMMTHLLGASWEMGTFTRAWAIPNLLRRLFGEGALSAAFVPAFTRALHEDPAKARRLLGGVTGALAAGLGVLTVVIVGLCLLMPPIWFKLPSDDAVQGAVQGQLLLWLTAILFPYVIPVCVSAIYAGAQNALGQFALPAAAPLMLNAIWIGAIFATGCFPQLGTQGFTIFIAVALTIGGFAQLVLNLGPLRQRGHLAPMHIPERGDPAIGVLLATAPTLLGLSATQLSALASQWLAEYLVGPGSTTHVYLANRLLLFPHALTALAAATAVFPTLSLLAAKGEFTPMRQKLDVAVHATMLLAVPAAAGMWAVSEDLVSIAFVHGSYTAQDAVHTARATALLVAGLPFLSAAQLYARGLYALGDNRTPAIAAVALLFINLGLDFALVLGAGMGAEGLTLASSLCSLINAAWLRTVLYARLPSGLAALPRIGRIVAATAAMLTTVFAVQRSIDGTTRLSRAMLDLALPIGAGMVAYLATHIALGGRELPELWQRRKARRAARNAPPAS